MSSYYPAGMTAGSRVIEIHIFQDSDIFCGRCDNERQHTVSIERNIETTVCNFCGLETETDLSEPDPDEAHDRAREGW